MVGTGIRFWSTSKSAKHVGEFWVLRFNGASPTFLPRMALDDDHAAAFEAFLSTKAQMEPTDLHPIAPHDPPPPADQADRGSSDRTG